MNYISTDGELPLDDSLAYGSQDMAVYGEQELHSRPVKLVWPTAALLFGAVLQMFVQKAIGPVMFAPLFLGIGLAVLAIPGLSDRLSRRAFILTFCTCVFVAGLNQLYQSLFYEDPRFTGILFSDENHFYDIARTGLTGETLTSLTTQGFSAGPVLIWQTLYSICANLGFGDGSWIGVMLNCLVIGMVANITVRTARHLFGYDQQRLHRVGTLLALCGGVWLYGSLFLRDCFALILISFAFWALARMTANVNFKNIVIAAVTVILAALCMDYVRDKVSIMFGFFALLALVSLTRRGHSGAAPLVAILLALFVLFVASHYMARHVGYIAEFVGERAEAYGRGGAAIYSGSGSLGYRLVVGQPMPIRLIAGSFYMLINPIPLWSGFYLGISGYHLMKAWNGLFIVAITPLAIVGLTTVLKLAVTGGRRLPALLFTSLFMISGLLSIAATTLDTRHMGQFWPAMLLLAVIPDWADPFARQRIFRVAAVWAILIFFGHILWFAMKFF